MPLVSWLVLRGKCRYCRTPISVRYPIVELLTGLSFAAVAWALGSLDPLPSLLIVVAASLAAVAIDLDGLPIPWSVDLAAGIGAGSLIVVAAAVAEPTRIGWAALGGGASAVVALLADRTDRGARRACIIATLGWSSSWLWAPGGLVLAGWALLVASAVAIGQRTSLDSSKRSSCRRCTGRHSRGSRHVRPRALCEVLPGGDGYLRVRPRACIERAELALLSWTSPYWKRLPVEIRPRRSSVTRKSWGFDDTCIASSSVILPCDSKLARLWSKVCIP